MESFSQEGLSAEDPLSLDVTITASGFHPSLPPSHHLRPEQLHFHRFQPPSVHSLQISSPFLRHGEKFLSITVSREFLRSPNVSQEFRSPVDTALGDFMRRGSGEHTTPISRVGAPGCPSKSHGRRGGEMGQVWGRSAGFGPVRIRLDGVRKREWRSTSSSAGVTKTEYQQLARHGSNLQNYTCTESGFVRDMTGVCTGFLMGSEDEKPSCSPHFCGFLVFFLMVFETITCKHSCSLLRVWLLLVRQQGATRSNGYMTIWVNTKHTG